MASSPMLSLTRVISSKSQLFKLLLFSSTRFPSTTEPDTDSTTDFYSTDEDADAEIYGRPHPFVKEGPELLYDLKDEFDAIYARVDLPGVSKEGLKMWVKDDSLYVRGQEVKKVSLYSKEEEPRKYSFEIDLPKNEYKAEDIRAVMESGVLRVFVPKIKPEEIDDAFVINIE
ncbi:PREDICTED: heat shock 22 kDa protein, mitochondrial-like [Populus euphratica]|uniref:Heat shock 22 kDa protein, mitochondrial-like n=1 Tax=Populus euphratica TaxID=75702 RepID=A0AAJ6V2Q3_POPEU|nr:PREDICTED: heat shock 22 kDa protein, mitochondrial-like [Populus euphratica]